MIRAILTALVLLASSPVQAGELDDIVDRYLAWRGGRAFAEARAIHLRGSLTIVGGDAGEFERWVELDRNRERMAAGPMRVDAGFEAASGWRVNLSGQVEDAGAAEAETARRLRLLAFDEAFRGGAVLSLAPSEVLDGREFAVVRAGFGDADAFDHFIDPATGELAAVRATINRRTAITRFGDWRLVEGVRIAFREDTDQTGGTGLTEAVVTFADVDPVLDDAVFARPRSRSAFAFRGPVRSTGPIVFDFHNNNRIYIPARVNGVETVVLLDSGAEATVLDQRFAERAGVRTGGRVHAVGTGGRQDAALFEGLDIEIGALVLNDITGAVIDLSGVERLLGRPLPVVLGKEVFNELVVDIDFAARTIAFHDPATFSPPSSAVRLPVLEEDGLRSVALSIEGREPVAVDFDLGNGSPLLVFPAYAQAQGLLQDRPTSKTLSGAVGGQRVSDVATVRSVVFAGVEFRDVPAVFPPPGAGSVDADRTKGNLGLPILSRFRLITDYPQDSLYLVANPDAVGRPFAKDRSGLSAVPEGDRIVVRFVSPGSPAEAAGLKEGDEITSVDGQPVGPVFAPASFAGVRTAEAGRRVVLGLSDGRSVVLTLRDYF